jgi:nitroimidazol reductase NimA-like FMN-containing flavoprotein (pyridoxamine 5'-phosphate oxidase superfamily)
MDADFGYRFSNLERGKKMIEKLKALSRKRNTSVLAMISDGKPHCSLMAYIADSDCHEIYMVTHKQTKKYQTLLENPWVSLLIDTREEDPHPDIAQKKALTIRGLFQKIDPGKRGANRAQFLKRHRELKDLVEDPAAEIISIRVQSLQLLEGVRDSCFALLG